MVAIASLWLLICVLISAYAWAASRRLVCLSLPFAAVIAAYAVYTPLGKPKPGHPAQGNYLILGVDVKENVYIKVLLKSADGVSTFYVLPYTSGDAAALQGAQDDARAGGGAPQATFGGDGDMTVGVHRPAEPVKPAQ